MAASSKPNPLPSSFIPAISTVAVAQICISAGYTSAEPAALRSLTSIASLYLQTLAASAASIASTKGRTQSNLLDLIRALEELAISQSGGFAGAYDPTRNLLKSSVMKDLRSFVRSVKEVPFPKPIRMDDARRAAPSAVAASRCLAEAGRGAHVPRWLPYFTEGWAAKEERRRERRWEEKGGIFEQESEEVEAKAKKRVLVLQQREVEEGFWMPSFPGCWEMKEREKELGLGLLVAGRERVRFELIGENSKRKKMKKRLLV